MRKTPEQWALLAPKLVAGNASPAHVMYLLQDAQADIAELVARVKPSVPPQQQPAFRVELVKGGVWPGLCIRVWHNLGGLTVGTHELYAAPIELQGVAEQLAEGSGFWRSCSGCYETEDGHPMGNYVSSSVLQCSLGAGCSECGGLGAVWDNTDYEELLHETLDDAKVDDWHMNPCNLGHGDVGAASGIAQCNVCGERLQASSTHEAFEKWNASHPPAEKGGARG